MKLKKLDESNYNMTDITFGIPYSKSEIREEEVRALKLFAGNKQLQSDTFPSAYWPDGSVKWAAVTATINNRTEFELQPGASNKNSLKSNEDDSTIEIDNGLGQIVINKNSNNIVDSIVTNDGELLIKNQLLVAETYADQLLIEKISATIENKTDTRVVVKSEFLIKSASKETVMRNTTRVYIYFKSFEMKYVSTNFVDEGTKNTLIYNLGIKTNTNLKSNSQFNKFAKFSLESGSYIEPCMTLASRKYREDNQYYTKQLMGQKIDLDTVPSDVIELGMTNAHWNNFCLKHNNPTTYNLSKSVSSDLQKIKIDEGYKSNGAVAISNGIKDIAIVPINFWQKYPSATEIKNLDSDKQSMIYWFNHESDMQFDHYSDKHHFNCYEGFEFIKSSAIGTANTSEFFLNIEDAMTPVNFYNYSQNKQKPHILIADEAVYRESLAAGVYGKRRQVNTQDSYLEQVADEMLDFYNQEVKQRSWYGYWDFGDVMHTFDNHRGQWWYDFGGYAWQNTELNPNMWLWYSFLRNQDLTSYQLACNMTRHNSDTDVYHFGEYKCLGSRHNVLHYGCSCKEPRISMAHLYRIYYYLHFDERVGEIMDMVLDVDKTMVETGPYDEFYDKVPGKIYMRSGPDWATLCSNWLVKYERTLENKYLDYLQAGIESIKGFENKLLEGPVVLYDVETRRLDSTGSGLGNGYHMIISFGAPQVWSDYCMTFCDSEFASCVAEFAEHYFRTNEQKQLLYNGNLDGDKFHWPEFAIGINGFNAYQNNSILKIEECKLTLNEFMTTNDSLFQKYEINRHKKLTEYDHISTNRTAQWCLNLFQVFGYEDIINKK